MACPKSPQWVTICLSRCAALSSGIAPEPDLAPRRRPSARAHGFLTFLDGVLANATPAEQLLEAHHGRWAGKVEPVFEEVFVLIS